MRHFYQIISILVLVLSLTFVGCQGSDSPTSTPINEVLSMNPDADVDAEIAEMEATVKQDEKAIASNYNTTPLYNITARPGEMKVYTDNQTAQIYFLIHSRAVDRYFEYHRLRRDAVTEELGGLSGIFSYVLGWFATYFDPVITADRNIGKVKKYETLAKKYERRANEYYERAMRASSSKEYDKYLRKAEKYQKKANKYYEKARKYRRKVEEIVKKLDIKAPSEVDVGVKWMSRG